MFPVIQLYAENLATCVSKIGVARLIYKPLADYLWIRTYSAYVLEEKKTGCFKFLQTYQVIFLVKFSEFWELLIYNHNEKIDNT